ncbi:hypothetical protein CC78DRAFT_542850 [Lojkania enalia]|uniref:MARVEL domain-containing protein n=1 Tax=Lojkania enalia TaxID=147567 RepID=A0A9P4KCW2_9PLEO|nr:hypothetical protein CC78DRAFT_542850 [Didymosphaeria enalia]
MEDNGAEVLLAERRQRLQRAREPELRKSRGVYLTRLAIRYLTACTSVAIIGCLVDAIRNYKKTKNVTNPYKSGQGRFPVWPEYLTLRPTYVLLGVAIVASATSIILCLASLSAAVRRMTKAGNIMTMIVSSIGLALWVAVTVYYGTWDTKETNRDLLSWTCKHSTPEYDYNNIDFKETCLEMRFAFWAAVALAVMEAFNILLLLGWFIKSRSSRGYTKM